MKKRKSRALTAIAVLVVLAVIAAAAMKIDLFERKNTVRDEPVPDWVDVQLIDIDGASRRGVKLEEINDIVVHYVGNPGTTAQQNRNYFNNPDSEVSSHFVIGLDGEVIQCVPLDEKSSATSERNRDTISIEVCHPDESGKFNDSTYRSLVRLTAWLCDTYAIMTPAARNAHCTLSVTRMHGSSSKPTLIRQCDMEKPRRISAWLLVFREMRYAPIFFSLSFASFFWSQSLPLTKRSTIKDAT